MPAVTEFDVGTTDLTQEHYTRDEAAEIIGVNATTVLRWVQLGRVKARKCRGRWQISRREVARMKAERNRPSPSTHTRTLMSVEERLTSIEKRMDGIEERFALVITALTSIKSAVDGLNARVNALAEKT